VNRYLVFNDGVHDKNKLPSDSRSKISSCGCQFAPLINPNAANDASFPQHDQRNP
jgi:hypothetical protein